MDSPFVGIEVASEMLKVTSQQVRNLCRSGKIKCQKVSGSWVIYAEEIDTYKKSVMTEDKAITCERGTGSRKGPIALSFFSGAMGLDIGLEQEGFTIRLACEIDNTCRKTILKNKPGIALIGDIRDYNAKQIRDYAGLTGDDEIDLVIGGPPCQAFSTAGKRKGFEDERGNVFLVFIERAIELRPRFIVIENVRGILSAPLKHRPHNERVPEYPLSHEEEKGGALVHILRTLRSAGYGVSFNLYNAANFGTPQKRERVVIVCSRDGQKMPYLVPTHSENGEFGLPKWRTFRDAIGEIDHKRHHFIGFPERRLRYYKLLGPGQYWRHLPRELQHEALGASYFAGGGKTGFLRRLAWDEPSPTLVTHPAMPATDLAHPNEDRPLSIEEYRLIQEFPEEWKIEGKLLDQYRQLGNAVPIGLGRAVARLLKDFLIGKEIKQYPGFPYSRYRDTDDVSWEKMIMSNQGNTKPAQLTLPHFN